MEVSLLRTHWEVGNPFYATSSRRKVVKDKTVLIGKKMGTCKMVKCGIVYFTVHRCHKFVESEHFPQLQISVASDNIH